MWQTKATQIILFVITFFLIAWNIYATVISAPSCAATISNNIKLFSKTTLLVPFIWGILTGHFFVSNPNGPLFGLIPSIIVLACLTIFIGLYSAGILKTFEFSHITLVFLIMGIVSGAVLWPNW